ncbi:MAG: HD domain-containing protein [Bacteriovorax sp.]|nr:HD domain-containing protein [Rhizobacter sp.]
MSPDRTPPDEVDGTGALCFDPAAAAQMERLVDDFGQMYRQRNEALKEVVNAHHDALFRLALAADFKDDDTGIHIVRIGFLAEALALALGQPRAWAEVLRKAAPMHDIGKIGIPDSVLKKPGRFTFEERQIMNGHPQIGADILGQSRIPLFQLAAEVALTHHERFDGCGYPNRLSGEAIALSGRIVSVVDFFDALTMDRCYRPAMPDDKVKSMLVIERGNAFDPLVVDTFLAHWPQFVALRDRITRQRLSFADLVSGKVDATDNSGSSA